MVNGVDARYIETPVTVEYSLIWPELDIEMQYNMFCMHEVQLYI